jgi:hypothetical protein
LSGDGSTVAIGSTRNKNYHGAVHIYRNVNDNWQQIGNIKGKKKYDNFAHSVSLSADGSILAVGSNYNKNYRGAVRIYQNVKDNWEQIGDDIEGEMGESGGSNLGFSVSLSADGSIVAIGGTRHNYVSGVVRIYQNNNNKWEQIGDDIEGEAYNDNSGWSVSLSVDGSVVAIGAPTNNDYNPGHVRIYQNNNNFWQQKGDDIDGESDLDQSGISVSLSADGLVVAIGAIYNDGNGDNSGHVRIYKFYAPIITGPSGLAGAASSYISIKKNKTAVHTFTAKKTVKWTLNGGADASKFSIDSSTGVLSFKSVPDYENPSDADSNNDYIVIIRAIDSTNIASDQTVTVTVTNVEEATKPVWSSSATVNVPENTTSVVTLAAEGANVTYAIKTNPNDLFEIVNGNELQFKSAPDFESGTNSYSVTVTATNTVGTDSSATDQTVTVTVTNVNETPTITSSETFSAPENQTEIGIVTANDVDTNTTLIYSVSGSELQIDSSSGVLSFVNPPDFETKSVYTATVTVSDGKLETSQDITVNVTNVDEVAPEVTIISGNDTVELGETWTDAGATATDASWTGTKAATTTDTVDTTTVGTYKIIYSKSDESGNTGTATRTVIVKDTKPTNNNIKTIVNEWISNPTNKYFTDSSNLTYYGHISDWDVSKVTNMSGLFKDKINFNDDISLWNVSNVTNMQNMFYGAQSFNKNISIWNVTTENLANMFYSAQVMFEYGFTIPTPEMSQFNQNQPNGQK